MTSIQQAILVAARKSLDEKGWIKGTPEDHQGRGCAIQHVIWGAQQVGSSIGSGDVEAVVLHIQNVNHMESYLVSYNDRPETTISNVRRWFDNAIAAVPTPIDAHTFTLRR